MELYYATMPQIIPQDGCPECKEKVNEAHNYGLHKQEVEPCEACAIWLLEQVYSLFKDASCIPTNKTQIGYVRVNSFTLD